MKKEGLNCSKILNSGILPEPDEGPRLVLLLHIVMILWDGFVAPPILKPWKLTSEKDSEVRGVGLNWLLPWILDSVEEQKIVAGGEADTTHPIFSLFYLKFDVTRFSLLCCSRQQIIRMLSSVCSTLRFLVVGASWNGSLKDKNGSWAQLDSYLFIYFF